MGSILSMQWPSPARQHQAASRPRSAMHVIAGTCHEIAGRLTVYRGRLLRNDIVRARGYRQQLVGMLQRMWGRDRSHVEAWVDAHLRNQSRASRSDTEPNASRSASIPHDVRVST